MLSYRCHDLPADLDEPRSDDDHAPGAGPAITVAGPLDVSDPRLVRHLAQTGEREGIPFQFRSAQHAGGPPRGDHLSGAACQGGRGEPVPHLHGPTRV